jgi:Uma2 family endonuclease
MPRGLLMAITRSGLTLGEFLRLPEEEPALEYEDGRVTQKVSPKGKHGRLQLQIAMLIQRFADQHDLGVAFTELRTTFAGASRVPDVAFYRRDRAPRDERGEVAGDIFEPPDLVIEIRSPGQPLEAQLQRCRAYVADGVSMALVVDSEARRLWRFAPGRPQQEVQGDQPIDFGAVLSKFTITPNEIFARLRLH